MIFRTSLRALASDVRYRTYEARLVIDTGIHQFGSVPLPVLEQRMTQFIVEESAPATAAAKEQR